MYHPVSCLFRLLPQRLNKQQSTTPPSCLFRLLPQRLHNNLLPPMLLIQASSSTITQQPTTPPSCLFRLLPERLNNNLPPSTLLIQASSSTIKQQSTTLHLAYSGFFLNDYTTAYYPRTCSPNTNTNIILRTARLRVPWTPSVVRFGH